VFETLWICIVTGAVAPEQVRRAAGRVETVGILDLRMFSPEMLKEGYREKYLHALSASPSPTRAQGRAVNSPIDFSVGANPAGLSYPFQTCGDGGNHPVP
jgi:hypothetical protein